MKLKKKTKRLNLITGTFLKEVVDSPVNGEISVIKSLAFGTYISTGNLTQSGGIIYEIWEKTLKKVLKSQFKNKNCLILGLGGGSLAKIMKKFWPEAKITGVDIDPMMVELGRKHLGLEKVELQVFIEDAMDFLSSKQHTPSIKKYDLICVDLYVGDQYPEKFESDEFIKLVSERLSKKGIAVFNRLYYDEKRKMAMSFKERLDKHFDNVDLFFPEANVMFVCRKASRYKFGLKDFSKGVYLSFSNYCLECYERLRVIS